MQLILETALDIESNMSKIIDKDVKANILTSAKGEIEETPDIPIHSVQSEADFSNVDSGDTITEKVNIDTRNIQTDIPQNNGLSVRLSSTDESDICIIENESKSEELCKEDCLEDDIISFKEIATNGMPDLQHNVEKNIQEDEEALLLGGAPDNKNIDMDVDNEIKESHNEISEDIEIKEEDERLLLECQENFTYECEKLVEDEEKNKIVLIEDVELSTDQCDVEIDNLKQEESEVVELNEEMEFSTVPCKIDIEQPMQKETIEVQLIDTQEISTIQHKEESETLTQDTQEVELIAEQKSSTIQSKEDRETLVQEAQEVELLGETELYTFHCDTETDKLQENLEKNEPKEQKNQFPVESLESGQIIQKEMEAIEFVDKDPQALEDKTEVITEISTVMSNRETEKQIQQISKVTEIEDPNKINVENELTVQKYKDVTDDAALSIRCRKEATPHLNETKSSIEISKETEDALALSKKEIFISNQDIQTETTLVNKALLPSENKIDVSQNDLKQNCCDKSDASIKEIVELSTLSKNKIDLEIKTLLTTSKQADEPSLSKVQDIDIGLNADGVSVPCANEIILHEQVEVTLDKCETITIDTEKTTNSNGFTNTDKINSIVVIKDDVMEVEESMINIKNNLETDISHIESPSNMDVDEVKENTSRNIETLASLVNTTPTKSDAVDSEVNTCDAPINNSSIDKPPIVCKLSNTLDIFSDEDEEESSEIKALKTQAPQIMEEKEKPCINIDDDDDIMLIDDDTSKTEVVSDKNETPRNFDTTNKDTETGEKIVDRSNNLGDKNKQKEDSTPDVELNNTKLEIDVNEKSNEIRKEKPKELGPLIPENFLKTAKTKLADMTREDLEEFCVLKIVDSIIDRTSLSDIKNKLRELTQGLEDYRKKVTTLTRQNRDLQVVLKSVQEEQRNGPRDTPITPLKITRSVGVQVFMEKAVPRKKVQQQNVNNNKNTNTPQNKNINAQARASQVQKVANQNIPVPRLVPAYNPVLKTPSTTPQMNTPTKVTNQQNGIPNKNPSPSLKPEKRPHNKIASNETVDLTDDEPPVKLPGRPKTPVPPVRVVPPQNLMAPQRQPFMQNINSPRKVYIPISGPPNQALRPGQTIMLKTVPSPGMRPRCSPQRMESTAVRMNRMSLRHPAPLPAATKQYQPPNWKSLPPAPDLKLSKVENGIVISWKIEDVPEDSYEEIASYQLFAYQETSLPANTTLWKKIGDVKALPLPMACTLTQFMAGFKYYFAVRAVDVRSRLGPFSLPGSILLLNKNILD